jgi:hypothetical protein
MALPAPKSKAPGIDVKKQNGKGRLEAATAAKTGTAAKTAKTGNVPSR